MDDRDTPGTDELPPIEDVRRLLAGPLSDEIVEMLRDDPRAEVAALVEAADRRSERRLAEQARLEEMVAIERQLHAGGRLAIAGVDKAGAGPLAGPIVAAAVILGDAAKIEDIDEPRRLDSLTRARLASEIRVRAKSFSIGIAEPAEIDELNVYHAGLVAMRRAVEGLLLVPDHVLVDAHRIPDIGIEQSAYVRGNARSRTIAAASLLAKEWRDSLMLELDRQHPGYGFAQNKGYGTPEHLEALRRLGPSPAHRMSSESVREIVGARPAVDPPPAPPRRRKAPAKNKVDRSRAPS